MAKIKKLTPNILKRIIKEEKLIERNLRLVRLDINNISHDQIKKLENSIENFTPKWDNIGAHRMLKNNCIDNIDILRYNHILRHLKKGKIK